MEISDETGRESGNFQKDFENSRMVKKKGKS